MFIGQSDPSLLVLCCLWSFFSYWYVAGQWGSHFRMICVIYVCMCLYICTYTTSVYSSLLVDVECFYSVYWLNLHTVYIYDYIHTYVHCVRSGQRTRSTQILSLYNNLYLYNEINSTRAYRTYYITRTKRGNNHILTVKLVFNITYKDYYKFQKQEDH